MNRPSDDRNMEQLVRSWLREDEGYPADRNRQIGRIMGRADETRQRRGPWRYLPFWHNGEATDPHDDELLPARPGITSVAAPRTGVAPLAATVVAVLALVVLSMTFVRLDGQLAFGPGASASPSPTLTPLPMHPADRALFERLNERTWQGSATDVSAALELYDDDAVHTALWLDESERFVGNGAIADRMLVSATVDTTDAARVRLPDHKLGARRYYTFSPDLGETSCVFWIENDQVTRHDCILPMYYHADFAPPDAPWSEALGESRLPSQEDVAARQELSSGMYQAREEGDVLAMPEFVDRDVVHHVQSDNQEYTITGFNDWWAVMSGSPIEQLADIDLPAPEGDYRWANFSSVGGGTLCVFWAREGRVARHDCIVPGYTAEYLRYLSDDPEISPGP